MTRRDELARTLYESHARYHHFNPRWDDEPWQSRFSWLNIADTALAEVSRMAETPDE